MKYDAFKAAIELASEALGRGDLNPQLAKLWFDGESVSAWDDNVAIKTECAFELEGGLDGEKMARFIARANGDTVTAKAKGSEARLNVGRSDVKFDLDALDKRDFRMRAPNKNAEVDLGADQLVPALDHVLKCVGQSLEKPEYHGVTFAKAGDNMLIYSGQPQVLVEATIPIHTKLKSKFDYVVLPEKFCKLVAKHYGEEGAKLELYNATDAIGGGLFTFPGTTVFGRSMSSGQNQVSMWDYIAGHVNEANNWMNMPGELAQMLDRAGIFEGEHNNLELAFEMSKGKARIRITIEEGGTRLIDVSSEIKGNIEPVVVKTNAKHLRTGAALKRISVDAKRILMETDDKKAKLRITQVAAVV